MLSVIALEKILPKLHPLINYLQKRTIWRLNAIIIIFLEFPIVLSQMLFGIYI